ncbi:MAG TPA: hypothetical protein HA222_03095 [Candidatus Diapherotrites archaeon]|uniref:Lipoprotein n=1 Tax=Candidatus Iainarchaeum sp. TaxID=3101447 RepID=A0A7J4K0E3_9ARCH|nr:hypothetical protein [Candidatus Diapherotrites archaeon]
MKGLMAFSAILALSLLLSGCLQEENPASGTTTPQISCINLCAAEKNKNTALENGPCLGNPLHEFPDWVCDIAHSPRTEADNLAENQCSSFREGIAKHFVELNEECEFIKQY